MTELIIPQVHRLKRETTLANVLDDFIRVELVNCGPRKKSEIGDNITDFILYVTSHGLSPKSIGNYAVSLTERKIKRGTIARKLYCIRRFFLWCHRMGYTKDRWHEYVPHVRPEPLAPPQIIGQAEYEKIKAACKYRHHRWIVVLGYTTGLRLGDCCNLRWSSIDQEKQIITHTPGKNIMSTGKPVMYPYVSGSELHQFIIELWQDRDNGIQLEKDYVCPEMALLYYNFPEIASRYFKAIFIRAGVVGRTFKHFRSTWESRMANSGMNLALAASIMGRSGTRSIMRYVRPDMEVARAGIAKALELHNHVEGFK